MSWERDAACKGQPIAAFFPDGEVKGRKAFLRKTIRTWCLPCPVREACLADAMAQLLTHRSGVWGGVCFGEKGVPFDPHGYLPDDVTECVSTTTKTPGRVAATGSNLLERKGSATEGVSA